MTYVTPDVIDDESAVAEGILASIADQFDGWQPAEGHVVTSLSEAIGIAIAVAAVVLKAEALDAYLGFGQRMLRIDRGDATVATCVSTWAFDTTDEVTIPAGTEAELALPDGTTATFIVPSDTVKPDGTSTLTGVVLESVEAGPESNGATNPAESDDLTNVLAVTIDAPASGGSDAEEPEDYANRVEDRARRLHLIPITAADHAAFATDVAGVARATAVNLLDPAHPGVDTTGHITIFAVDAEGAALSGPVATALQSYFDSIDRPLNVTVHVEPPTFVALTITATIRLADDAPAGTAAAAEDAISARLDKAQWDADPSADGGWAAIRATHITIFDVAAAIDDIEGIVGVETVTINGGSTPVALPAPVALPNVTSVTVTPA